MEPYLWPLMLLLVGIAIVVLELFVPSGGVLAVLAGLCFLGSIALAFTRGVQTGLVMLTVTAVVVPALLAAGVHVWPNTPVGRRILGRRPAHPDEVLPDSELYRGLQDLLGRRGIAGCDMLPGGTVLIDRRSYDAISLGMAIDDRTPVEVVDIRMGRLVVRPCEPGERRDERVARETAAEGTPDGIPEGAAGRNGADILSRPIDSLGIDDPLA